MPIFIIETTFRLPVYRRRRYEADTLAEACRLAIEDDNWSEQKEDIDSSGDTYVTGVWPEHIEPYDLPMPAIPSEFDELVQRKADCFDALLALTTSAAITWLAIVLGEGDRDV